MDEEIGRGGMTSKLSEIVGSEFETLPLLHFNLESRIWFVVSSDKIGEGSSTSPKSDGWFWGYSGFFSLGCIGFLPVNRANEISRSMRTAPATCISRPSGTRKTKYIGNEANIATKRKIRVIPDDMYSHLGRSASIHFDGRLMISESPFSALMRCEICDFSSGFNCPHVLPSPSSGMKIGS